MTDGRLPEILSKKETAHSLKLSSRCNLLEICLFLCEASCWVVGVDGRPLSRDFLASIDDASIDTTVSVAVGLENIKIRMKKTHSLMYTTLPSRKRIYTRSQWNQSSKYSHLLLREIKLAMNIWLRCQVYLFNGAFLFFCPYFQLCIEFLVVLQNEMELFVFDVLQVIIVGFVHLSIRVFVFRWHRCNGCVG